MKVSVTCVAKIPEAPTLSGDFSEVCNIALVDLIEYRKWRGPAVLGLVLP